MTRNSVDKRPDTVLNRRRIGPPVTPEALHSFATVRPSTPAQTKLQNRILDRWHRLDLLEFPRPVDRRRLHRSC